MGVRVTVVSTVRSQPPMIADELRRQADAFLELEEIAPEFTRRQVEPRGRATPPPPPPAARPLRATPADPFGETMPEAEA
jgi:hypothetical protein